MLTDEPVLTPARRGFSLAYKNKTLLSTVDPADRAEKAAGKVPSQERTLYFCPSPLLGYGLETFISRLSPDSAILCVETDKKLLALSVSSAAPSVLSHPRFLLTGEKEPAVLCALVRETWGSRAFRRVVPLKLNGGWQLDAGVYDNLETVLRNDLALEWGNAMTLVKLGRRYARNVIRNLLILRESENLRDFSCGSDPVLVLGAGPSLDGFLDTLSKRASLGRFEKFRIICVDTCIPVLLDRGIRPDLVVALESQYWNVKDFIGRRNSRIAAAFDLSSYPAAAELLGGRRFFFLTPWTTLRFLKRIAGCFSVPVFPPLGSVGLTALKLAGSLTKGPLVVAGIDFSFTLDAVHARGSPGHLALLQGQNRFRGLINADAAFRSGVFHAVSKSGVPVLSNPAMRTYRNLFEEEFSGDIYEISGTGLSLGLKTLATEEALDLLLGSGGISSPSPVTREPRPPLSAEKRDLSGREKAFVKKELGMIVELRDILTGVRDGENLLPLLEDLDYLWAHFPEYAGAENKRPAFRDTGFLKRIRAEIDPFVKLWELLDKALCV
ncbi:MAG: DUF115 domain-containing protein [Treponema sp.]|jgi:hypothetical protein|nr:DUF115 domain-containing protein [Treponema sp.]